MIAIRLKGGLGNQMFQYAFACGMAERLSTELKIDCSLLLDRARGNDFIYREYDLSIFNINSEFSCDPRILRSVYKIRSSKVSRMIKSVLAFGKDIQKEKHFHVDHDLIANPRNNSIYDGWWQSELYFQNVKDRLREEFTFRQLILEGSKDLFDKIDETNSVCLNIRRTDFLKNATLNTTSKDYFLNAAGIMANYVDNPHFFVFSDDIEWCKENIKLDFPIVIVGHEYKGDKFGNYLQLMKQCKHFIIPNSSFAWWAIWLNENDNKRVIAPKNWFTDQEIITDDLVPSNWMRI